MPRPSIPFWLTTLKKGRYSLTELVKHSEGKSKQSISRTMNRLQVTKEYDYTKKPRHNMIEVFYLWDLKDIEK